MNMKNKILAIPTKLPAIPVKPRAASVFFNYWRNSSPTPSTKNSTLPHLGQQ